MAALPIIGTQRSAKPAPRVANRKRIFAPEWLRRKILNLADELDGDDHDEPLSDIIARQVGAPERVVDDVLNDARRAASRGYRTLMLAVSEGIQEAREAERCANEVSVRQPAAAEGW